jgi:hypothetical protein
MRYLVCFAKVLVVYQMVVELIIVQMLVEMVVLIANPKKNDKKKTIGKGNS